MSAKKEKKQKKLVNYYYMLTENVTATELEKCTDLPEEKREVWSDLNILELILMNDSLVLEDANEDFEAEEDQEFLKQHQICQSYAVSFDELDQDHAMKILKDMIAEKGGFICSDTDDFMPYIIKAE